MLPRGLAFLAGTATGLALGYFLHSEKGAALRSQLSETWGDTFRALGERLQDQMGDLVTALGGAMDNGAGFVELLEQQLQQQFSETAEDAQESLEAAETSFENGMDKARARLQQKFANAGL